MAREKEQIISQSLIYASLEASMTPLPYGNLGCIPEYVVALKSSANRKRRVESSEWVGGVSVVVDAHALPDL